MSTLKRSRACTGQAGFGLVEIMVSVIISMLMVIVIYQVYGVSEGQKRTITAGGDAQQNANLALYVLERDLSMAGNGIMSSAIALDQCPLVRPLPVLIEAGATAGDPDAITILFGGSGSLSTPVAFLGTATTADPYPVRAPVGFSPNDVIVAVEGSRCTLSRVNPGAIPVSGTGIATIAHTPLAGDIGGTYSAVVASLVNLGPTTSLFRVRYSVDAATQTLQAQNRLPTVGAVTTVVGDVVNLKAQYGLDTDNDSIVDLWQDATDAWAAATLVAQPLATLQQIQAARVAVVTRSTQYEKDPVTVAPLTMFDGAISMPIAGGAQHYRYRVLETIVPMRNAIWNPFLP